MVRGSLNSLLSRSLSVARKWQQQQLRRLNIHEYQGSELMSKYGINVPKGVAISSLNEVSKAIKEAFPGKVEVVVKSQVLVGGRGLGTFKNGLKGGVHILKTDQVADIADFKPLSGMFIRTIRTNSIDVSHYPEIKDPEVNRVFKDFMAIDWGELPDPLVSKAVEVLSKPTNDSSGIESLKNVFRAAEAVEEFTGTLETLKLELDDSVGLSGENVKPLSKDVVDALVAAYERYVKYLDSFGPDEWYLRKKVETQLGTWMIHLKMRCSGLGSEWGKVTVLGTSGISGSYVEQRAP